ncbi:MAG: hypothetical protein ACNA78_12010, partial [Balneolaceae bacterium]
MHWDWALLTPRTATVSGDPSLRPEQHGPSFRMTVPGEYPRRRIQFIIMHGFVPRRPPQPTAHVI